MAALGLPATDCHHDCGGVGDRSGGVVMSVLSTVGVLLSTPNSSTKAPRVPEPSSADAPRSGALANAPLPPDAMAESPAAAVSPADAPTQPASATASAPHKAAAPASTASCRNRRGKREDTEDAFMSSFLSNARVGVPEPPPARAIQLAEATHKGTSLPCIHDKLHRSRKRTEQHP